MNTFSGLGSLESLILEHNNLLKVEVEAFSLLQSLVSLDLSFNMIKVISDNSFAYFENLVELSLSGNSIQSINENSFLGLNSLKALNLSQMLILPLTYLVIKSGVQNKSLKQPTANCKPDKDQFDHSELCESVRKPFDM